MTGVAPLPAVLAGAVLFFVPGLALLFVLGPRERRALPWDEALFLVVATSVATSAWAALVLAEAGRFSVVGGAALVGGLSLVAALVSRRVPSEAPEALPPPVRGTVGPTLVVLALALALQARPSQYLVGGRDPGAYVAAMGVVARTGALVTVDRAVVSIPPADVELFFRHPDAPPFSWARFMGFDLEDPQGGRVYPQFFHLFPAFGAYLFATMGVKGALATPPVFGVLGTVGTFLLARRLFGPAVALLSGLLLGTNVVQVWFARYPVSEPVSQMLFVTAALALVLWEERSRWPYAAVAGGLLGLALLVRIDAVLLAAPLGVYALLRALDVRRDGGSVGAALRRVAPLVVPWAVLALHAAAHAVVFAPKYLRDVATRKYWHYPWPVWVAAAAAGVTLLALLLRHGPAVAAWLEGRGPALRRACAAGVVVLALYAAFLRPHLSAWAGADGNDPERVVPALAGVLGTLGFRRLAAHDAQAFLRLSWFVTPLGLALGVLGLFGVLRRWQARFLFPVLALGASSLFYFYKIRVYNDYFFALRRFVPVVLPLLLVLAAAALVTMARAGGARRLLAGGAALALLGSFSLDTARIARHTEWANAVRFVADVARRFSREDVVVFEQPRSIHLLSLPLWAVHGLHVLELARFDPDPERLAHLVDAWRGTYRNIYFVHTYRTDLCGTFLERVEDHAFGTFEWERSYGRPPAGPVFQSLRFTVSRVVPPQDLHVPPLPEVDLGGSDDVQVSGFFGKEGGGARTYRWTGRCGSLYVPGARGARSITLTTAYGRRPDAPPVVVSLAGLEVGRFTPGPEWSDVTFPLPALPEGRPPVLRLDVRPFRPADVDGTSQDVRDLGVMVDRVRFASGPL